MSKESKSHDPYAAWRSPSFRLLLMGRFLFLAGTAAQGLAVGWEVYDRTDDALLLGLTGLMRGIPMILFTLPAGWIADRYDRRKVMVISLAGATLTSLGLAWFSYVSGSLSMIFALLFLDASFARLGGPAGTAIVPLLVPRKSFENAIKWQSNLFQFTALFGPAVGGFLLTVQLQTPYLLCAVSSVVFIVFLLRMHIPDAPRAASGKMLVQIKEGISFVWHRKVVLGAVSLDLFAVLFGGAVYLLPVFARDIIVGQPAWMDAKVVLAVLTAAPAVGALLMGTLLTHLPPIRKAGRTMFFGVFGFGVVTIAFGLTTNFYWSWAFLFLTGVFDNISVVVRHTLVNLITPNEMRGRVSAVNSIFIGSSNELGGFESGLVARFFGPLISVVSGGIATILVVLIWVKLFPGLRRFGKLSEVEEEGGGEEG